MTWREEILGDGQVRLILGEKLSGVTFGLHMARLAKANKIGAPVGVFCRCEKPKRNDVMNRKRWANVLITVGASTRLFRNYNGAHLKPARTTISGDDADIARRLFCVAVKLGRKFIGIEIHEPYFDIAVRRISEALKQPDLFIEAPKEKPVQEGFEL